MASTPTGRCLARLMASRRERPEPTRLRAAAALFRRLRIRLIRQFRSTTAPDRISSRRIYASRRRLALGNQPERRPRGRVETKAASVVPVVPVGWAAVAVVVGGGPVGRGGRPVGGFVG